MPSKAELKEEIDNLKTNLKETTKRLTALEGNPGLLMSDEKVKLPAAKCDLYISKIESEIAKGKTYWEIVEEQYNRKLEGMDGCLPCEREYVEAKEALTGVGEHYRSLVNPADVRLEGISTTIREESSRELNKAEARVKAMEVSCGIKFPKVISRLRQMKPISHVGRWNDFMNNQKQLLLDLESDLRNAIPGIEVRIPSYEIPITELIPEYERIKQSLTKEQREKLEEKEREEKKRKAGTSPSAWAPYLCPECGRPFRTLAEMHAHLETHKEYKCPYCEEKFKVIDELLQHVIETHVKSKQTSGV
jgi:DNA-directed RNA polymerase subunit RPC12/RpoP